MKRAFTLIELLVVIAIIAILAAILFPVFAQAKISAKKASDLSNVKQLDMASIMYATDDDDLYPLQSGATTAGVWGYNPTTTTPVGYQVLMPYNWSTEPVTNQQYQWSQGAASNTIQPYVKSYALFVSPGGTTDPYGPGAASGFVPVGYTSLKTTYTYNGYLSSYNSTSIQSPTTVPVWTSMNGNIAGGGWVEANPQLNCNVPGTSCSYRPAFAGCNNVGNGDGSPNAAPIHTNLSLWLFNQGQNWCYFDGHAKFRKVGVTSGINDGATEPFQAYSSYGVETGLPNNDGCHSTLFNPDYVPANGFN